jgi:hypothetical protein
MNGYPVQALLKAAYLSVVRTAGGIAGGAAPVRARVARVRASTGTAVASKNLEHYLQIHQERFIPSAASIP